MTEPAPNPFSPQLSMLRQTLEGLPALRLPEGYRLRTYQPGDGVHWERIIGESFEWAEREGKFASFMEQDAEFRPERIFFICQGEEPVATSSAWFRPALGEGMGYLHFVGVMPNQQGKSLGREVSVACLHHMVKEGRTKAVLHTDDFRIPAIKTYLGLGFEPLLNHENQRERWRVVFEKMGRPELGERFRRILEGAVV